MNCCWCCCWALWTSFCLRSSITFRCEFECFVSIKVGLIAGRYSGTSRPDLYRTPQALQSVLGPMGPVRHCGVLSVAQCRHFRPSMWRSRAAASRSSLPSLFFDADVASGERTERRDFQLHGAARERLLRAFPGTDSSGWNFGLFRLSCSGSNPWVWDSSSGWAFTPDIICSFRNSSLENDSSTKLDSHSSSARSSWYC